MAIKRAVKRFIPYSERFSNHFADVERKANRLGDGSALLQQSKGMEGKVSCLLCTLLG
jgi:hypothetical protein